MYFRVIYRDGQNILYQILVNLRYFQGIRIKLKFSRFVIIKIQLYNMQVMHILLRI